MSSAGQQVELRLCEHRRARREREQCGQGDRAPSGSNEGVAVMLNSFVRVRLNEPAALTFLTSLPTNPNARSAATADVTPEPLASSRFLQRATSGRRRIGRKQHTQGVQLLDSRRRESADRPRLPDRFESATHQPVHHRNRESSQRESAETVGGSSRPGPRVPNNPRLHGNPTAALPDRMKTCSCSCRHALLAGSADWQSTRAAKVAQPTPQRTPLRLVQQRT